MSTMVVPENKSTTQSMLNQIDRIRDRLNNALRGKEDVVQLILTCLLAQGHLLLEDRPGLGKTTVAKSLSDSIGGRFTRVQCTPDLLPSDITGFQIFNQRTQEFEFRPGPVFSDVLLADEINRATPRTQSALLEAMGERQVTVDTQRRQLAENFFVIATQNPHEQHGTYPLPEAQLDRFAMKLSIGYPRLEDECVMLQNAIDQAASAYRPNDQILEPGELKRMQNVVARVCVARPVMTYLVQLAHATRHHHDITLGVSPRGLLTWQRVAQAWAFLRGRDFVTPDDVQDVAHPVLSARLGIERDTPEAVVDSVIQQIAVPT